MHPFEELYGFLILLVSMRITSSVLGIHTSAAWSAVITWGTFNIMNHLAFDSTLHLPLPYPAFPRDHQMHHRFPHCNLSTLTTVPDRILGTFKPYESLSA